VEPESNVGKWVIGILVFIFVAAILAALGGPSNYDGGKGRSVRLARSFACGRSEEDGLTLYAALAHHDAEGAVGLVLRGKALLLEPGTEIDELSTSSYGVRAVFIASGAYIGESCWIPQAVLDDNWGAK
jgi:hypothetical protein